MPTDYPSFTKNIRGSKAQSPLIIYIAEEDHGDMSYSSLLKQVIEDCDSKGLSTKVFSEFESQTYKVNGMANNSRDDAIDGAPVDIERQLEVLRNVPSKKTHIQTTEFLDDHLIAMGGVKKRWRELVPKTWEQLPEKIKTGTPENLLRHFEDLGAIDNPAILQRMIDDVTKGELPKEDAMGDVKKRWRELVPETWEQLPEEIKTGTPEKLLHHFIGLGAIDDPAILQRMRDDVTKGELAKEDAIKNSESYYRYWKGCLNYKLIHEGMAQDVRKDLVDQATPDVIIMIAGKDHIQGLNQQLPEFADSQKVVIRNSEQVVIDGVGQLIEFGFNEKKREAHIPDLLSEMMIQQKSLSKRIPPEHLQNNAIRQQERDQDPATSINASCFSPIKAFFASFKAK